MLKLKKIINYKIKGFLSLELIFLLGVLGFFIQKIISITYIYIKQFYIFNSVLITVNTYMQIPMSIDKSIEHIKITSKENNNLEITTNKKDLKSLYEYLRNYIHNKDLIILEENNIIIKNNYNSEIEE